MRRSGGVERPCGAARGFRCARPVSPVRDESRQERNGIVDSAARVVTDPSERIIVRVDPALKALIPRYLENRRADVDDSRRALERDDYETIRVIGHRMKGNGAGYGFDRLSELGAVLERAAVSRNAEAILACVADVADYLDRVEVR